MYPSVLKTFISKFEFINQKRTISPSNIEINISSNTLDSNKINGTISIKNNSDETDIIIFESKLSITEDILIFKTQYQSQKKIQEEIDTFTIINTFQNNYSSPKTKYLFHITNGKILQAYRVSKKYKFENGISESLSKFNMENKEVSKMITNVYETNVNRKR